MIQKLTIIIVLFVATGNTFAQQSTASKQVFTFEIEVPQLNFTKKIWIYFQQRITPV